MNEKRIAELVKEIVPLLEEALDRFEKEDTYETHVCLNCRKIYVEPRKRCNCFDLETEDEMREDCVCLFKNPEFNSCSEEKHTILSLEAYEGPTDIIGALECLKWILREAETGGEGFSQ